MKKKCYLLAATLCLLVPTFLHAQSCTWIGSGSSNWDDSTQWTCGHVPGIHDTAIINSGAVTVNGPHTVGFLTIASGQLNGFPGSLTIEKDMIIEGFFSFPIVVMDSLIVNRHLLCSNNAELITFGTKLKLNGGGKVVNLSFEILQGSMIVGKGAVLEMQSLGQDNFIQGDDQSSFENDGTLIATNIDTSFSGVHNLSIPGLLLNNGKVKVGRNMEFSLNGTTINKNAKFLVDTAGSLIVRPGNNFTGAGHCSFDSTRISGGGVLFVSGNDSISLLNHSVVKVDNILASTAFNVDSSCVFSPREFQVVLQGSPAIATINSDINVVVYIQTSGTIAGTGNIHIGSSGGMLWTGGTIGGQGNLIDEGGFNYSRFADVPPIVISGRKAVFKGGGNWFNPRIQLTNGSTIQIQGNDSLVILCTLDTLSSIDNNASPTSSFTNSGFIIKQGTSPLFINTNLKNSGTLSIEQGIVSCNDSLKNKGTVQGGGTLDLSHAFLDNKGVFTPHITSPNILSITGNFKNHTYDADVAGNSGAGTGNDQLLVSGSMDLQGSTLQLHETGTVATDSFVIMKCDGSPSCRTGVFDHADLPLNYSLSYTGNEVIAVKNTGNIFTSAGTLKAQSTEDRQQQVFAVVHMANRTWQIQGSGSHNEINIISLDGKLVKKMQVNGIATVDLSSLSAGIYIVHEVGSLQNRKIIVE